MEIGLQRDYFNRYHAPVGQARFEPSNHQNSKQWTRGEETQIMREMASLAFSHEDNLRSLKSLVCQIPMESNNFEAPISSRVSAGTAILKFPLQNYQVLHIINPSSKLPFRTRKPRLCFAQFLEIPSLSNGIDSLLQSCFINTHIRNSLHLFNLNIID
jgi:hypothetical protein